MNRNHIAAVAISTALGVTLLTGCGSSDKDKDRRYCPTTQQVLFFGTDGHYHYGSPSGKVVPANQVPHSARKVPGYKAPKVSLNKGDVKTPKAPAAPAPAKVPAPAPRR